MSADVSLSFVDTNVLVYAYDRSAGPKREAALALLNRLWEDRSGCISIQVLQEFYVTMTRKVPLPLSAAEARRIVRDLGCWRLHAPDVKDVLDAIDLQQRFGLSFWDGMIIQSALHLECETLWSEDLSHGQWYESTRVKNPFM
jgi:predicted nucleic acid-binding protein